MKFAKKTSLLLSLAAAAACSANAADAQAKFNLPHATHIGAGVLPAGEYLVTMSLEGNTKAFITPAGRGGESVIVLPMTTDSHATCSASSLAMRRVGPEWNVSSICFAEPQIAMYFPVPSEKITMSAAKDDTTAIAAAK